MTRFISTFDTTYEETSNNAEVQIAETEETQCSSETFQGQQSGIFYIDLKFDAHNIS